MIGWQDVETGNGGFLYGLMELTGIKERIVEGQSIVFEFPTYSTRGISLRIAIDQQTRLSSHSERSRKIDCGHGFTHSTLTVGNADDSTHRRFPYHMRTNKKSAPESRKNSSNTRGQREEFSRL